VADYGSVASYQNKRMVSAITGLMPAGTPTGTRLTKSVAPARLTPVWDMRGIADPKAIPNNGKIEGYVYDASNAAKPYVWVRVYVIETGFFIAQCKTDVTGYYVFHNLDPA
jgi:hypothetical protein